MSALRAVAQIKSDGLVIDPAALPIGTGMSIYDHFRRTGLGKSPGRNRAHARRERHRCILPLHGPLLNGIDGPLAVSLVYASRQCTG